MSTPTASTGKRLSDTQLRALRQIAEAPMKRGLFSGWGPRKHGYNAHRIDVRESTANRLLALGLIQRNDAEGDWRASTISITPAGRSAIAEGE